jgi:hypothetical protein
MATRPLQRLAAALLGWLLLACVPDAASPAQAETCTLQTPLVPGVPGSPGHFIPSEINPNGASELAALMRRFVSDWRSVQGALREHKALPKGFAPQHAKVRCAWPTDPQDRNAVFDGLAVNYLGAVRAYEAAPAARTFNAVVASCRACHEQTCGGPLVVIDSLQVPESAAGLAK